jgi:hypothetical protein
VNFLSKIQPHPGHENHLCVLTEKEMPLEKMKPLVKDAKFICVCCRRVAAKAENLCMPESL